MNHSCSFVSSGQIYPVASLSATVFNSWLNDIDFYEPFFLYFSLPFFPFLSFYLKQLVAQGSPLNLLEDMRVISPIRTSNDVSIEFTAIQDKRQE